MALTIGRGSGVTPFVNGYVCKGDTLGPMQALGSSMNVGVYKSGHELRRGPLGQEPATPVSVDTVWKGKRWGGGARSKPAAQRPSGIRDGAIPEHGEGWARGGFRSCV